MSIFEDIMNQKEFAKDVKKILKAELKRYDVTYEKLAELLNKNYEMNETTQNINSKINRGTFTAIFMVQCLKVIGCKNFRLED